MIRILSRAFFIRILVENVATYPSAGVRKGQNHGPKCLSLRERTSGVPTNVYLRKMLEKPKRRWSADFENEGLGVVSVGGRY